MVPEICDPTFTVMTADTSPVADTTSEMGPFVTPSVRYIALGPRWHAAAPPRARSAAAARARCERMVGLNPNVRPPSGGDVKQFFIPPAAREPWGGRCYSHPS